MKYIDKFQILSPIGLQINTYLKCKECNQQFNDVGNFTRHIHKIHDYNIEEYQLKYYSEFIPRCIESGEISDWKLNGHWFGYNTFCKKYKKLKTDLNLKISTYIRKAQATEYNTKYLDFDFLMKNKKPSDILKFWNFLFADTEYWKRLSYNWYGNEWTDKAKQEYIISILNMNPIKLQSILSHKGWIQRGNESLKDWRKFIVDNKLKFNSYFSNVERQTLLSKKSHEKYNTVELQRLNSARCIEFWMNKGYTEQESHNIIKIRTITNGLDFYINKYGIEIGPTLYDKRIKDWQNTLQHNPNYKQICESRGRTLNFCVNTYGELKGKQIYSLCHWGFEVKDIIEFDKYYESYVYGKYDSNFYNSEYRESILKSQNYKCGCKDCDNTIKDDIFELHHIDFDKKNSNRNNLIFLCRNCHQKTKRHNRNYWITYYTEINKAYYNE
jgi:hypothetical protein